MRRSPRRTSGQFILALQPEPSPHLDEPRKEEVLIVLADLLLEALGVATAENQDEREERDEPKDHA